jgi:ornithine cyclodeaminase/alanine dehydrogenase-like protein (mu-crystallin family)
MSSADVAARSSKWLARRTARTLALIGAGAPAERCLEALQRLHRVTHITVWDPSEDARRRFAAAHSTTSVAIKAVDHPGEAIIGADLIVLTSASPTALVENGWVKPGAHVIAISVAESTGNEIEPALLERARVFDEAQLGEMERGAPGRRSLSEVTIFRA